MTGVPVVDAQAVVGPMVERVACAIFTAWAASNGSDATWQEAVWIHAEVPREDAATIHGVVELARVEARAAIAAMRDPDCPLPSTGRPAMVSKDEFMALWNAQVDAMLEPSGPDGSPGTLIS